MELDPLLNYSPKDITTIHIMGICGTGMAALAGMLKQAGYTVTGSDTNIYPPMSDFLKNLEISIFRGYEAKNLEHQIDLVIVGNVITKKNPEAQALAQKTIPYLSFPQALSFFFIRKRTSLVVAGTHGKTTTCSLLASSLNSTGHDPSFMIGGIVRDFDANFRLGNGPYFISEGDEYDTAFFDKESKFLHYRPHFGILTSIEFDHADIFDSLDDIKKSFKKFIALFPEDGLLIANLDDENVREVIQNAKCPIQGYGCSPKHAWSFKDIQTSEGMTTFDIFHNNELYLQMSLTLSGTHNCMNGLAVTALLHNLGIEKSRIQKALANFGGVKRRQEVRGVIGGITIIDDFAHHPTAVRETLNGLKVAYGSHRLIAVFEPRTNSSRRSIFQKQYVSSFSAADQILIREPLPLDNVHKNDHFSSQKLAEDLEATGHNAISFSTTDEILYFLDGFLKKGDVVAILSNGGFDDIHTRLMDNIKLSTPEPN